VRCTVALGDPPRGIHLHDDVLEAMRAYPSACGWLRGGDVSIVGHHKTHGLITLTLEHKPLSWLLEE